MTKNKTRTARLKQVWAKTDGICAHCGKHASGRTRSIDHYIPKSLFGGYDLRNLMPLCINCNKKRGIQQIDPNSFYSFAPKQYIQQCIEYENELYVKHRALSGDMY